MDTILGRKNRRNHHYGIIFRCLTRYAASLSFSFILLLLILPSPLAAQFFDLSTILNDTDSTLQWDGLREIATIWNGEEVISFRPGNDWGIHNFRTRIVLGDTRITDGILQFSPQARRAIQDYLEPAAPPATLAAARIPPRDSVAIPERIASENQHIAAIFIDPGHGGKDPGAIGTHTIDGAQVEVHEKDVVLTTARYLHNLLSTQYPEKQIVISRTEDNYITLENRTETANGITLKPNETIVFISLHANASFNENAQGFEIWYLPTQYRRDNLISSEQIGMDDTGVLDVLNTIKDEELTIESVILAKDISENIEAAIGTLTPNRGLKQEAWYVVRNAKMPSVLIELGFITNLAEARLLTDDAYLYKLAHGIYNGIVTYIEDFER